MSGGSLDYLFGKSASDLINMQDSLQYAVDGLVEYGHTEAAVAVESLLTTVSHYETIADAQLAQLSDVLHALEWCLSFDTGPDNVAQAVSKWMGKNNIKPKCSVCGLSNSISWMLIREPSGWRPFRYCRLCKTSTFPISEFNATERQAQAVCDQLTVEGMGGYLDATRKSKSK